MSAERFTDPVLGTEYEMLRGSLRGFVAGLPDVTPGSPPDAHGWPGVVKPLALGDLLAADTTEPPDVDWLAWLVTFEELGSSPLGVGLLGSIGFGAVVLHLAGPGSEEALGLRDRELAGEIQLALAIQEPGSQWARGHQATIASDGSAPRLSGTKLKVAQASAADVLLVVADRDGTTQVYAVDPRADGVTIEDEPSIDPGLSCGTVTLEGAPGTPLVADEPVGGSMERAVSFAKLGLAALSTGASATVLGLAVDYLEDRRQFGKPLSEFQAVSHRCGRARIQLEQMRAFTIRAAVEGAHGDWRALSHSASLARMFCGDGYGSIAAEAMRAQGAIATMWENELSAHFRRAYWLRDLLGGRAVERRLILDEALRLAAAG